MPYEGLLAIQREAMNARDALARLTFLGRVKSIEDGVAEMELLGLGEAVVPGVQLLTSDPRAALGVAVGDTALCLRTGDGVFAIGYYPAP